MTNRPFFSVVVPVYNRAGLIEKTLTSVLQQSFIDFEVIVVNDGSTDDSKEVIGRLTLRENRIKLINQENKERGAARNNGIKNSSGQYIVFFDSDDFMHVYHLELLHEKIIEQKYPFLIATHFDFQDETGHHYASDSMKLKAGFYDYSLFLNGNPLACNFCIKNDNSTLNLFIEDKKYSIKEDWMFLLQNTIRNKIYIVDRISISMYDHKERSMLSDNAVLINKTLLAQEWILKNISLNEIERKILLAHVCYFCGIHAYLNNSKQAAIGYAAKAIRTGGFKMKYIVLLIKSLLGKKAVSLLK